MTTISLVNFLKDHNILVIKYTDKAITVVEEYSINGQDFTKLVDLETDLDEIKAWLGY